jgi:hypothetical protein
MLLNVNLNGANASSDNRQATWSAAQLVADTNNAQFVSQTVPNSLVAGQTTNVAVTLKNTGTTTWTTAAAYRLGSQNPQGNVIWGTARVYLSSSVTPGQSVTFNFAITAPSTVGTFNFQWRMVQEGIQWFGDQTPNVAIAVKSSAATATVTRTATLNPTRTLTPTATPMATLIQTPSSTPTPTRTSTLTNTTAASVTATTTRTTTKTNTPSVISTSTPTRTANPTNTATATATRSATPTTTAAPNNNAQFVLQNVPKTLSVGQPASVSLTMKNTGTTTWTSAASYRLGSQNPQGNTTWGIKRVELPNSVAPGQLVTFTFTVLAPTTIGSYNFQWRMVQDGTGWFGALTANVAITVTNTPTATPTATPTTLLMPKGYGAVVGYHLGGKPELDQLGSVWYFDYDYRGTPIPGHTRFLTLKVSDSLAEVPVVAQAQPGAWWQFGNEPNDPAQDNLTPSDYATRYRQFYTLVKGADPSAHIVPAGIGDADWNWADAFREAYRTSYGSYPPEDGWNIHNYLLDSCANATNADAFKSRVLAFRDWMTRIGEQSKPLFLTEYGVLFGGGCCGCPTIPPAAVTDYMNTVTTWMAQTQSVTAWAWFAVNTENQFNGDLFQDGGGITLFGQAYRNLIQTAPASP